MHIFETQLIFIHLYFLPVDLKMKETFEMLFWGYKMLHIQVNQYQFRPHDQWF